MTSKDPYEILGVSKKASQDEIKRAYRRLAKEHHPDRNPGDKGAERRFKEVQAAYEVLGNPQKRAQYDQFGAGGPTPDFHNWNVGGGGSPFGRHAAQGVDFDFGSMGDLSSIFEQFFSRGGGGGAGPRRPRSAPQRPAPRGADIEYVVEVSFEESLAGAKREIVLSASRVGGKSERLEFRVPAGVRDGQKIRIRGKGQPGAGGAGDLMITCRVRPHPVFRRDGDDVLLDLPLSLREAALGAKVEIPTPEGSAVITVPPGANGGAKLRLRGKGVGNPNGQAGDLYVVLKVETPKNLSPRAKELIEELDVELGQAPRQGGAWKHAKE